MKNLLVPLTILSVIALISACGSPASGVKFSELERSLTVQEGTSKIIVYRPDRVTGSGDRMNIVVNDEPIGKLLPVGYLIIDTDQDYLTIHTETSAIDRAIELDLNKPRVVYLKTVFSNYVMTGAWDLIEIDAESAGDGLQDLRESIDAPK